MISNDPKQLSDKDIERIARDEASGHVPNARRSADELKAEEEYHEAMRENAPYLLLGMQMAMTIALGAGIGWWIDSRTGSSLWLGVCSGIGAVMGMGYFILVVMRLDKKNTAARSDRTQ